jgi:hypothetical protein
LSIVLGCLELEADPTVKVSGTGWLDGRPNRKREYLDRRSWAPKDRLWSSGEAQCSFCRNDRYPFMSSMVSTTGEPVNRHRNRASDDLKTLPVLVRSDFLILCASSMTIRSNKPFRELAISRKQNRLKLTEGDNNYRPCGVC